MTTRDELVEDLERWYFGGLTFAEHKPKTCAGEWRDILNEACARLAEAKNHLAAISDAVEIVTGLQGPFFCDIPGLIRGLVDASGGRGPIILRVTPGDADVDLLASIFRNASDLHEKKTGRLLTYEVVNAPDDV